MVLATSDWPCLPARQGLATKFDRVAVLMGGPSSEREISLKSGKAIYESLRQLGLDVVAIDIKTDDLSENTGLIKSYGVSCAFLALHGRFGEDGQIQELLDTLGIPYTCSGALASKLAMDKVVSRKIFEVYGLNVPTYRVLDRISYSPAVRISSKLSFPLVVKPVSGGSSIGLSLVDKESDLINAVNSAFSFDERVLIEEFIPGRELTVGILEDEALPVVEIITKNRFFDFQAKYQPGATEYIVPAKIDDELTCKIQASAVSAHKLLGCQGCSRVDIILDKLNKPYILEINTIPGFTQTSLLPKAAKVVGIDFGQLCFKLLKLAYEKSQTALTC